VTDNNITKYQQGETEYKYCQQIRKYLLYWSWRVHKIQNSELLKLRDRTELRTEGETGLSSEYLDGTQISQSLRRMKENRLFSKL
jgi:hypothetical protein